ncbi:hypothetical protein FRB99_007805 [Tulasnella sp. 403]|nr:hypothetical protein FRB99_007805 [Tulasnella sp. 403]
MTSTYTLPSSSATSTETLVPPASPALSCSSSLPDVSSEPIQFILPDIIEYCPFELKVNPNYPAASAESDAWFDSFNIHKGDKYAEFHRARFGLLTAMSYPEADYTHLRNCCDFMSWLFAFDDLTDDGGLRENIEGTKKAAQIMMQALRNPKTFRTEFKVGETLRSFWERACETASQGTQRRFVETTQLYVDAIYQQVVNRRHDEIPSIETFIQLRRDTSAVKLVFALVEYSLNLDLPDEVFENQVVRDLEQGANDILTWANDMYSFNVEQSKGDTQNLVVIAMNEMGLDVQGAVDFVGDLIMRRIDRYVADKELLPSWGPEVDAQLAQYVAGLERWVIGVLHWSFDSERYFGAEHERIKKDRIPPFSFLPSNKLPFKEGRGERAKGLTEIRGSYYNPVTYTYLNELLSDWGEFVDGVKFAAGSFTLMPPERLKSLIDMVHSHGCYVSTGGFIERVISTSSGDKATVVKYLEACKEVGFDVLEISSIGLKPKPEIGILFGAGGDTEGLEATGTRDSKWLIEVHISLSSQVVESPDVAHMLNFQRAEAFLKAGADRIMIESEGITENVKNWRTDVVSSITLALPMDKLMFEAAEPAVFQ